MEENNNQDSSLKKKGLIITLLVTAVIVLMVLVGVGIKFALDYRNNANRDNKTNESSFLVDEDITVSIQKPHVTDNPEATSKPNTANKPVVLPNHKVSYIKEMYIFGCIGQRGYNLDDGYGEVVKKIRNGSKVKMINPENFPYDLSKDSFFWYIEANGTRGWANLDNMFEIGRTFFMTVDANGGLFIRSGPGMDYEPLLLIEDGSIVEVRYVYENFTSQGYWAKVRFWTDEGEIEGYCSCDYLAVSSR